MHEFALIVAAKQTLWEEFHQQCDRVMDGALTKQFVEYQQAKVAVQQFMLTAMLVEGTATPTQSKQLDELFVQAVDALAEFAEVLDVAQDLAFGGAG